LVAVMHTVPKSLALSMYEDCLDGAVPPSRGNSTDAVVGGTYACAIGTDKADCATATKDLLTQCKSGPALGCLAVLESNHFQAGSPTAPKQVCEKMTTPSNRAATCNAGWPGTWPTDAAGAVTATTSELSKEIKCRTKAAEVCTKKCEPCAACVMLGAAFAFPTGTGAGLEFCTEYALCTTCTQVCSGYGECFSNAVSTRAMAGVSIASTSTQQATSCARMGRVADGWCDEPDTSCTHPTHESAWACPAGEDALDCGGGFCNIGCLTLSDSEYALKSRKHNVAVRYKFSW
jgi:hypothetical protein